MSEKQKSYTTEKCLFDILLGVIFVGAVVLETWDSISQKYAGILQIMGVSKWIKVIGFGMAEILVARIFRRILKK